MDLDFERALVVGIDFGTLSGPEMSPHEHG
jgi:hypothetical protein